MKKIITTLVYLIFVSQGLKATIHTINISGFAYSPANITATVGDTVIIAASTTHPLVQVDQANWNSNTPTAMAGGWGTKTSAYTFTVSTVGTIYYGCVNHMASMGMKGQISVVVTGVKEVSRIAVKTILYPNPVINGEFTIKAENITTNGKVVIYSIEGKLIETYILTNGVVEINSKLPTGEYFYTIVINQKEISREKFLITNK